MSTISHLLYVYNPIGELLTIITDGQFISLSYGLKENEPGVMELVLPPTFDTTLLMVDGIIEIYRSVDGGTLMLEGDTAWFIRKPAWFSDSGGTESVNIRAYSACDIMGRRIVAYYAGTSYTEKISIRWDNLLREIARENYGSLATDAARNLSPWFSIEPDLSEGTTITRAIAWREVLKAMQDIVEQVKSSGVYASFDVVRTAPATFEFRVFIGARGIDHSASSVNPVIVSKERHNLSQPNLEFNWEGEHNFIYGLGTGQGSDRVLQTAQDDSRIAISPFNRQEFNRDARHAEVAASVLAEANTALEEFRPKVIFTGTVTQTVGSLYGIHWSWGDIVTAEYRGFSFDCHLEAVTVFIDSNGTEVAEGQLRSVQNVG